MLSILIPTYNYDISTLVFDLHKQATKAGITFEIICFDDESQKFIQENEATINSLSYSKIIHAESNLGRVQSRQALCDASKYDWLLFLDADVIPKSEYFLTNYIDKISSGYDVLFGGFAYSKTRPDKNALLRWKYGKRFEEVDAEKRNLKPHQLIISANFFIKKAVFNSINSQIDRKSYGLDNYFASLLKQNDVKVFHLNNEVYHFGLESSLKYLYKAKECIITLLWAYDSKKMLKHDNKLLGLFLQLKKLRLNYVMSLFYKIFSYAIEKNLIGGHPNMVLLQVYKLGYICYKDLNKSS